MQEKPTRPGSSDSAAQQSPADIAREAFRRLAVRRIAPTPEAYRDVYDEVAGIREPSPAERVLTEFAANLAGASGDIAGYATRMAENAQTRDWHGYGRHLQQLADKHLKPAPAAKEQPARTNSIPLVDDVTPAPVQRMPIPLVDDIAPAEEREPASLVDAGTAPVIDGNVARMLREMLARTLNFAVTSLLQGSPELTKESESLATDINMARTRQALSEIEPRLKQFCFRVEMRSGDIAEERELLLRLFRLLIENIGELLEDDSWLSGQITNVQEVLSGPINYATLMDATRSLKEVIYKQSMLKHSLAEAKTRVRDMMLTAIDRLGAVATSTGDYHRKIEAYSQKISAAKGVPELNQLLEDITRDTRTAHIEALRSHDDVLAARNEVHGAETRIQELESQLVQMSELVREDQLTGSLNRRGLDEVLEREMARAQRRNSSLCIAMLDVDDFKKLNDTYGHSTGDEALIHLVRVVKDTLRSMDVIARFGGEEFMIVLPDTSLEAASQTVTRVQRELTKRIFMHNHERLLITFSAGAAMYRSGEEQVELIKRADEALYKAKKAGKNRVVNAD
ncbi:GGDEF domain-containing protein [Noviherbaspirillum cavernae]|uniref:diguanylate cyclase n=1 Tax=Noviherbaspirillum cavernae TaxID=2320862 RepID=A0A418X0F9_9BURK|nr:GGDEF domain-containing protein [Noviherbaspirillum cavernae]RJG05978.1 GGDEF domain-containing protein [Noviherbaspirillum cavernae]